MKKIILSFDQSGFEYAESMYSEKLAQIKAIQLVAKNELGLTLEVTDSKTLKENIFKAVETKYNKENTLHFRGAKLVELMELNLKPIFDVARIFDGYDAVDKDNKPTKEHFTLTVDNDKELELYNHALKVIDLINETRTLTNNVLELGHYHRVFGNVIKQNSSFDGLEALPSFVKS